MEWKEALFTLSKQGKITLEEYGELIRLPDIRDGVFFPEYLQYGYVPEQTEFLQQDTINVLQLGIVSVKANRKIHLEYLFFERGHPLSGSFLDQIYIFNADQGWGINVDIEVLAKKRADETLPPEYRQLKSYAGSTSEKVTACLQQIKSNYDRYARDIITGDVWDDKAWKDYDWR